MQGCWASNPDDAVTSVRVLSTCADFLQFPWMYMFQMWFQVVNPMTFPLPTWTLPHELFECFSPIASSPPLNSDTSFLGLPCLCTLHSAFPPHLLGVVALHIGSLCTAQSDSFSTLFPSPQVLAYSLQTSGKVHEKEVVGRCSQVVARSLGILICHASHSLFCEWLASLF